MSAALPRPAAPLARRPPLTRGPVHVQTVGYLGCNLGFSFPLLGVKPYESGTCLVTSVGMMGLDYGFAPFSPFLHVPVTITIGSVKDQVVAENGQPVVRPVLQLSATVDHRFLDGAQAAYMANRVREVFANPELLDEGARA